MRFLPSLMIPEYDQLFRENLLAFTKAVHNQEKKYTAFYPMIGREYFDQRKLMVIGQAVNGWVKPGFTVLDDFNSLKEFIKTVINESNAEGDECPLNWVNTEWKNPRINRSFFWNVTYKLVIQEYHRTDSDWNEVIAWSNLMKIAPYKGGNPNAEEIKAQEYAAELFIEELNFLQPQNVILFTNLETWAKPIFEKARINYEERSSGFIQATATYGNSKIIVTKRTRVGLKHQQCIDELRQEMV